MRSIRIILLLIVMVFMIFACDNNVLEIPETITEEHDFKTVEAEKVEGEAVSEANALAKAFYEEYFAQEKENFEAEGRMGNAERIEVVKRKYFTENLIEELHLRSRQISADAITNSQDNQALYGKLTYKNGKDKDTAIVTYRFDIPNGYEETNIELHFIDMDGKKLADELNTTCITIENGKEVNRYENKTKWANKPSFTEEDIKEMESIKKELDNLEAEGFIG